MEDLGNNAVVVLIVNYHSTEASIRCMESIVDDRTVVCVIDNSGQESEHLAERCDRKNAFYINAGSNLGYIGGAVYGARFVIGLSVSPKWLVVCNPDIVFGGDFFDQLSSYSPRSVAVIGPRVVETGSLGGDQNPFMRNRPRKEKLERVKGFMGHTLLANAYRIMAFVKTRVATLFRRNRENVGAVEGEEVVYAVHGSCFVVEPCFFQELAFDNNGIFLFSEEIYLAEKAREQGKDIIWYPSLRVFHEGKETTKMLRGKDMTRYHFESLDYVLRRFF